MSDTFGVADTLGVAVTEFSEDAYLKTDNMRTVVAKPGKNSTRLFNFDDNPFFLDSFSAVIDYILVKRLSILEWQTKVPLLISLVVFVDRFWHRTLTVFLFARFFT